MDINCIRIYSEVLEQGLDFKEYILKAGYSGEIINIYAKKSRTGLKVSDSLTDRIRKSKDVDVLITAISKDQEFPILMVEYSTAVPTDDHKMQRSDVYFWSSVFKVPLLKIYPVDKGMSKRFGGGKKFNDGIEIILAYNTNALFFPIKWETMKNSDALETKDGALSCITYNPQITSICSDIINKFSVATHYKDYYNYLKNNYSEKYNLFLSEHNKTELHNVITNSNRFKWIQDSIDNTKKLRIKINRFGHAMDPDRGILYFANMLLGGENCITEIQINRNSDFKSRGGYKALFDGASKEKLLSDYVKNIIKNKNNIFDDKDALYILEQALNIEDYKLFDLMSNHRYLISDKNLEVFLSKCSSITSKCIFFLSSKLILTDINRNTICEIEWNREVVEKYLNSINTNNYKPIQIKPLSHNEAKEDIVTFASVELYKKIKCELLAVSYPGAQGDRCILTGEGRKVLREYIDIIAYKTDKNGATVFLEECKENISNSLADVKKLNNIINSTQKTEGLKKLISKTSQICKIKDVKISVGAKFKTTLPSLDVDYIFMFCIDSSNTDKTIINYTIAIIDTTLADTFSHLVDFSGKLKGSLEIDKIYSIQ